MTSHDALLRVDALTVRRGRSPLVDNVSFDVPRSSCTILLGPNGSGKTTLLRSLAGALPYDGHAVLDSNELATMTARTRAAHLAYGEQEPAYPASMTVAQFILLGRAPLLARLGVYSSDDRAVAAECASQCDVIDLFERRLGSLSGGEKRRASIAQTLAQQTPLVLLDEPTSTLDIGHQQTVLDLVDTIRKATGTTFVIALHDLTLTSQYATQVVFLKNGRLVQCGAPESVLHLESLEQHYQARMAVLSDKETRAIVTRPRSQ